MDSCAEEAGSDICWFCRKGRHEDCMGQIPTAAGSEGPHDCTFDTKMKACKCGHQRRTQ